MHIVRTSRCRTMCIATLRVVYFSTLENVVLNQFTASDIVMPEYFIINKAIIIKIIS